MSQPLANTVVKMMSFFQFAHGDSDSLEESMCLKMLIDFEQIGGKGGMDEKEIQTGYDILQGIRVLVDCLGLIEEGSIECKMHKVKGEPCFWVKANAPENATTENHNDYLWGKEAVVTDLKRSTAKYYSFLQVLAQSRA